MSLADVLHLALLVPQHPGASIMEPLLQGYEEHVVTHIDPLVVMGI